MLDAIYRVDADDDAWLTGLLESVRAPLDDGLGIMAWSFRLEPHGLSMLRTLDDCPSTLTPSFVSWARDDPEGPVCAHRGRPAAMFSERLGRKRFEALQSRDYWRATGGVDVKGIVAIEPDGWGIGIGALARAPHRKLPNRDMWERVAGHIQAAHRLRRRLGTCLWHKLQLAASVQTGAASVSWSKQFGQKLGSPAQAVIDPSGRILDASADARDPDSREALRNAAVARDRARARLLRSGDISAIDSWRALVDGRWSLLDCFESDGRRFLIARRNEPGVAPNPRLDRSERAVLGYRAAGHSLKIIAYELGFSVSWTSRLLRSAMAKLGLRSVSELGTFPVPTAAVASASSGRR